jgi:hypothetical protein
MDKFLIRTKSKVAEEVNVSVSGLPDAVVMSGVISDSDSLLRQP